MTENQPEIPQDNFPIQSPEPVTKDQLTEDERAAIKPGQPEPFDAPADVDEAIATGYAVYDRTLGRYVTGVTPEKPGKTAITEAVAKGHSHKVVRV